MNALSDEPRPPRNAEDIVEWFLNLVMVHPEKAPKTQRDQLINQVMVTTFSRAQENLRDALSQVKGQTQQAHRARALADVRADGQVRPITVGGTKVWPI